MRESWYLERGNAKTLDLIEQTETHILVRFFLLCRWRISNCSPHPGIFGMYNSPSSFFSSSFSAGASPPAAGAAPPPDGAAAAAPPPDPTFNSMSLTSLPSSACESRQSPTFDQDYNPFEAALEIGTLANRVVHIGSTSSHFAALRMVWSLSACS